MVFPVIMYSCKSWTIKKAECWGIDAFQLWCRRRPLTVPWRARRSNQSLLREINPEYSLEGLKLKLEAETPVFGSSDAYSWLIGKIPDAGKDWGQKEKGASEDEMAWWHYGCNAGELGANFGRWRGTERPGMLQSMGSQRAGHDWMTKQQQPRSFLLLIFIYLKSLKRQ